jgi:hypothetical protein
VTDGAEAHAGLPTTRVPAGRYDHRDDGRVVRGRPIYVRELVWNGGARSFDVYDAGTDECLTEDESFGHYPGDADLERVAGWIDAHRPDLQEDATL